jgi:monovalent cation:H+ antiporter-2, CPA2 family
MRAGDQGTTSEVFIGTGPKIGVILLLFTLGLEHTAGDLVTTLRTSGWMGWSTCSTLFR